MMNKRQVGSRYEDTAAAYLIKNGYTILQKNFRCRQGEIDLVGREGRYLVFIEVKYRRDEGAGDPALAVNELKQNRIRQTALYYLYSHGYGEDTPCRFDVVSILGEEIRLIRDAF